MHPKNLLIKDFSYTLPQQKIAKYPLPQRDKSKLLIYRNSEIKEDFYYDLDEYIPSSSLLVFNNTKVVEARILFQKSTGGKVEIFCLEPYEEYGDITNAMLQKGKVLWKCLVGGAKKWKKEGLLKMIDDHGKLLELRAIKKEELSDCFLIEFNWNNDRISFAEILHLGGVMPLPPYLNREAEKSDYERYQTIYAKYNGSVAAPTAGLHFTERLFGKLERKNIKKDFVTLHVGAGTFMPVKTALIQHHEMHAEFIEGSIELIENLIQQNHLNRNIIAVGTTSFRTMESLYWLGVKTILHPYIAPKDLYITQWEPYEIDAADISTTEALQALQQWMQQKQLQKLITKTQMIIVPGYEIKVADALITNFHQPQSTLLLLVAAIVGNAWEKIYRFALENNFRFLSYGDGSLLWKDNTA